MSACGGSARALPVSRRTLPLALAGVLLASASAALAATSQLNIVTNMGRAYFDAAQFVLQKRALRGLTFNMMYQFSKSIDTGSDFSFGAALAA